jgi:hypothetical protein
MEETNTVSARKAKAAAAAQVQDTRGLAQGGMFRQRIAIVGYHLNAIYLGKMGIQAVMKFV